MEPPRFFPIRDNHTMDSLPIYTSDLIDLLDKLYPPKCPSISDLDREIWVYKGKRELIDTLKVLLKRDEEEGNILDS
jgi:hypothetical protein